MNRNFNNLDELTAELEGLKPATLDSALAHKLEMALHQADEEFKKPTNIIAFPFAQWTAAAAAVVVALFTSTQLTKPTATIDTMGSVASSVDEALESRAAYQVVNGRIVPADVNAMQNASYQGIEVLDGRAYQAYRKGQDLLLQPVVETEADKLSNPDAE